ncbi:T9SS type A sorting domain-containing protein [Chryseobacterium wanjuense]
MKKFLFSLMAFMSMGALSIDAQTTKISFEAAEGYTLGNLGGQQGWSPWGGIPTTNPTVANSNATDGVNSFTMLSEGDVLGFCGVEKNISSLVTGDDVEISFDYKFDAIDGSDYEIAVYNDGVDYYYTAALRIDYETGTLEYRTASTFANGPVLNPNQWYNMKIAIKKSTNTLQYYLNGTQIYTGNLGTYKNAQIIDFVYDDYGTGFKVDNIQVTNLAVLATGEVSKKDEVTISPNPATDRLNIATEGKILSISIFDAKGSLVKTLSNPDKTISVSDLSTGNYLIKVKTDKSEFTKKFIKK